MPAGAFRLVVFSALVFGTLGRLSGVCLAQAGGEPAPAPEPTVEQPADQPAEQPAEPEPEPAQSRPVPAGMHLSSYASKLCARVDRQGALDSGAGVLQLVDADSGQPLPIDKLSFANGPMLFLSGVLELPGVEAHVRMLATPTGHLGDQRVRTVMHVELLNHGQDLVLVRLGARLSAGGGNPFLRPVDALEFVPGTKFTQEDGVITRDGSAILAWEGPDPQVKLMGAPAAPDDTACLLTWELPVQPNTARYLDLTLAGAAHQPQMDEAGWRQALSSFSYINLEEQLVWQTESRGTYTLFDCALPQVNKALSSSVHFLRSLGQADHEVLWLTDRPYGFPPTDAAAPAEIVGLFHEWGLGAFAKDYLHQLVAGATASGQQLSPERRTALVAGLVSSVRLIPSDETLVQDLAGVIRSLVVAEAAVEPWLDPQVVRADMAAILMRADPVGGAEAAAQLPALRWAEPTEGPVAAHMLAARKALSDGEREVFWEHYSALLDGTSRNGLGSMQPGGDLDGRFPIGFMSLSRAMLIDDHGRDLRLLPGSHEELLPERGQFDQPFLPTVFGLTDIEAFRVPGHRLSVTLRLRQVNEPYLIFVDLPAPLEASAVVDSIGGKARLMPDGSLATAIDPTIPGGLNFTVTLSREQPGGH